MEANNFNHYSSDTQSCIDIWYAIGIGTNSSLIVRLLEFESTIQ